MITRVIYLVLSSHICQDLQIWKTFVLFLPVGFALYYLRGLEYLVFSSGRSLVRFPTGLPIDGIMMLQGVLILK